MKLATAKEVEQDFSRFLRIASKEDVIVTRDGKALARLSAMSQEDYEEYLFETDPRFINYMKQSQRDHATKRDGIPFEEVCRQLGLPTGDALRKLARSKAKSRKPKERK